MVNLILDMGRLKNGCNNMSEETDFDKHIREGWRPATEDDFMSKELPWCQIYDLDGTLAIRGDRGPYDWDRVGEDTVNEAVAHLIRSYCQSDYQADCPDEIIFMSGRKDMCRGDTEEWIEKHTSIDYSLGTLIMRKDDDNRDDVIVKEEMYNEHIKGKYNVRFVVDDRPKVCRMWRRLGLPVFQVGDPDVEF